MESGVIYIIGLHSLYTMYIFLIWTYLILYISVALHLINASCSWGPKYLSISGVWVAAVLVTGSWKGCWVTFWRDCLTRLPLWKSDFLELIIAAGLFLWLFAGGILFKNPERGKNKVQIEHTGAELQKIPSDWFHPYRKESSWDRLHHHMFLFLLLLFWAWSTENLSREETGWEALFEKHLK